MPLLSLGPPKPDGTRARGVLRALLGEAVAEESLGEPEG